MNVIYHKNDKCQKYGLFKFFLYRHLSPEDQLEFLKGTGDLDRAVFLKEIERYDYEDIVEQLIISEETCIENVSDDEEKLYMNGTDIADMAKVVNYCFKYVKYFCKVNCSELHGHRICKEPRHHYIMLNKHPRKLIKLMPACDDRQNIIEIAKNHTFERFNKKQLDTSIPLSNWDFYEDDGTPFCVYDILSTIV